MRIFLLALVAALAAAQQNPELQPFTFPWNDASPGVTNLASWQPREAGADGWVQVEGSRYRLADRRIRFLGVNVTAAMAFPSREQSDAHAARLARFGFNGVRFHHLEAPWDKSRVLIDYAAGTSRQLSAARLDRLHYFISALARQGIFINMNLLVSREFQPGDGLGPEITRMNWKDQHILGFFNDTAVELHKEYARQLLTAPNPYRDGRPLVEDPAVAFVEIMNENGLLQKWHEGIVDAMPEVYRRQLAARWNRWLAGRYENTAAMLAAWKSADVPPGPNRLSNGDFALGPARWTVERHTTAAATVSQTSDFTGGRPALRINVTTPGSANWHIQLNQGGISVEENEVYTLSFWARAATATPISASVQRAHTDYVTLGASINATLGPEWREYKLTYQSGISESRARINFNGFGDRLADVSVAAVEFRSGGRLGGLPEGASLEDGSVPLLRRAESGATLDHRRDWTRFVFALEKAYWDEMHRYIKSDLGYKGIVFATIVANSPPNAQAGMDAIDSHAYWQHPVFPPGLDFNAEQWAVQNTSMVNDRNGGVIGGMARQRVAGKPHNVTELQFCSPNFFVSEGPLLAAAYAALQDWDSVWFFEYPTGNAEYTTGFFDHSGHPGRMANNLLAAAMFRRGDVTPAVNEIAVPFDAETELNASVARGGAWNVGDGAHVGVPGSLSLVNRLALATAVQGTGPPLAAPAGQVLRSDTGQLRWDLSQPTRGVVTIDTQRTKAVVGYTAGRAFDFEDGVSIAPGRTRNDWSTIGLTLTEGDSIDAPSGARAVLIATGEHANTGMQWKDDSRTSVGSRWGRAPVLIEVVPAAITLPVAAGRLKAWALDERGQRRGELAIRAEGGKSRIDLGVSGATLWYELEIARQE